MRHSLIKNRRVLQQGQALTEFLVIAAVLLPLFLLIPIIAKYQDIAHATQMASRYVAFDSMVRYDTDKAKSLDELQNEVRRRFFSTSDAPIKTNDVSGDFKGDQNMFWRGPTDLPLIEKFSDITVTQNMQSGFDGKFFKGAILGTNAGIFGTTGIQSSIVSVKLANLPDGLKFYQPFNEINLSIAQKTSVLSDGWSGKDPGDVQQKTNNSVLFPASAPLKSLQSLVNPVITIGELLEVRPPQLGVLDYWADQVPCKRLRPAINLC